VKAADTHCFDTRKEEEMEQPKSQETVETLADREEEEDSRTRFRNAYGASPSSLGDKGAEFNTDWALRQLHDSRGPKKMPHGVLKWPIKWNKGVVGKETMKGEG
jgi:hypothetical protein